MEGMKNSERERAQKEEREIIFFSNIWEEAVAGPQGLNCQESGGVVAYGHTSLKMPDLV